MILDTCFLIDLQREIRDGKSRGAAAFLRNHPTAFPKIALVTWMEFAEGYADDREKDCRQFLTRFPLVEPDPVVAWQAARIARALREGGKMIGDHDVWIAATALVQEAPVVTRNAEEFRRVAGLVVLAY